MLQEFRNLLHEQVVPPTDALDLKADFALLPKPSGNGFGTPHCLMWGVPDVREIGKLIDVRPDVPKLRDQGLDRLLNAVDFHGAAVQHRHKEVCL